MHNVLTSHIQLNSWTAFFLEIKQTKMTSAGLLQRQALDLSYYYFSVHPASSAGKIQLFTSKDHFNVIGTKHFILDATSTVLVRKGLEITRTGC